MTEPTWAGRTATPPTPGGDDERAGWIPVVGVIAALGLVGAGGYVLGSGGSAVEAAPATTTAAAGTDESESVTTATTEDATTTSAAPTTDTTTAAAAADSTADAADADDVGANDAESDSGNSDETADAETADDGDTANATGDDTTSDDAAAADADAAADDDAGEDAAAEGETHVVIEDGETRGAVLSQGVLYLGGAVPSREVADAIIERAAAIVGEENIVDEYVIDPDAPLAAGAPLYVEDVVLFAYGESTYDPQFEPLLDLGLALLHQNPNVTVTVITHTDSSGSAAYNDLLSYRRGQSVAQYWVDRGVAVERIVIDARGERDPRADNSSAEGAQLNRRAEFYIEGLLG